MNLQTQIPLKRKSNNLIDYKSKILLIGSCFSENIGDKFHYFKFNSLQNPFGILFHPKAIESFVINAINNKEYTEADIFYNNEMWHCFDAHSKLSAGFKEELLINLNKGINSADMWLQESSHLIITLGTAWVYRFLETGDTVANCHKVPQKKFSKELLTINEIQQCLQFMIDLIRFRNPEIAIIFTVSPVRHLKDGFTENTLGKAHLISAVHSLMSAPSQSRRLYYFPAYEIMMDELRDYRFYKEDMVHPNQTAIDYIWKKFLEVWMSQDSFKIMDDIYAIQKGLKHKPFNPKSEAHKKFLNNLGERIEKISDQFPHIKF